MGKGASAEAGQADPSEAFEFYEKAAIELEYRYPAALGQYQLGLQESERKLQQGIDKSNEEAYPFTQTAKDAITELRDWIGLGPLPEKPKLSESTSKAVDTVRALQAAASSTLGQASPTRNSKMQQAAIQNIIFDYQTGGYASQEPERKEERYAWEQANQYIDYAQQAASAQIINNNGENQIQFPNIKDYSIEYPVHPYTRGGKQGALGVGGTDIGGTNTGGGPGARPDFGTPNEFLRATIPDFFADKKVIKSLQLPKVEVDDTPIRTPEEQGEYVRNKLENLPGYQFQYQEGKRALDRGLAARGLFESGNAARAITEYGQEYASSQYDKQLQRLSGLAGLNMPAFQQNQAQNFQGYGQMSGYPEKYGGAAKGSLEGIAQGFYGAYTRSGDASLKAEIVNAQLRTQASIANAKMSQQSGMAALGIAGKLLGGIF